MTYHFSERSLRELSTVRPELVDLAHRALSLVDFGVDVGRRGPVAQAQAVATGASKKPWPQSAHNVAIVDPSRPAREWLEDQTGLSRAFDLVPAPRDWNDLRPFYHLGGIMLALAQERGVQLRWGGDWDRDGILNYREKNGSAILNDLPHFELVEP